MGLRIGTFNIENLMNRFDFGGFEKQYRQDRALALYDIEDRDQYEMLEAARMVAQTDDTRQLSALALSAIRADVVCLQEVDNLEALEAFESRYLYRMIGAGYPNRHVTKGNDSRGIDLAFLHRDETLDGRPIEFVGLRSHASRTFEELGVYDRTLGPMNIPPHQPVFRRDFAVLDLKVGGVPVSICAVHLKSMGPSRDEAVTGRDYTRPVRAAELRAVRAILAEKFEGRPAEANWVVCGDFNDYRERIIVTGGERDDVLGFEPVTEETSALDTLLDDGFAVDLSRNLPPMERWTLFHTRGPGRRHLCQLDYVLASPAIARANPDPTILIERRGQPWRTPFPPNQPTERFPRTGWDRPKASDHCPLMVELDLPR